MNSLQRVMMTLQGQPTDRRAVGLTLSLYGARLTDCPLDTYYSDPLAYADGMDAVCEQFQSDWLTAPFAAIIEGEAFGSRSEIRGNQAPILTRSVIETADQIDRLVTPDVDSHPRLLYVREAIQAMTSRHAGEVPVCGIALSPLALPALLMGLDGWLSTFLFSQANRDRMLEITVPFFAKWGNSLLSDGAAALIVPALFANPRMITRELAETLVRPVFEAAFAQIQGPILIHHMSNPLAPFIDVFAGLPNVAGFIADPLDDLGQMRAAIGPQYVLFGGIDGPTLGMRSPAEITAACLEVLEDRRDDPRFILTTTAADIAYDTPAESIHAVREVAEEFARGVAHVG
jgi:uroporphyrinogen decarboxylase